MRASRKFVALALALLFVFTFVMTGAATEDVVETEMDITVEEEVIAEETVQEAAPEDTAGQPQEAIEPQSPDKAGETTVKYDLYTVTYSFKYNDNPDGTVTVTGMNYSASGPAGITMLFDCVVPAALDGKGVTALADNAISGNAMSVEIPSTVKSIALNAFAWCTDLKAVSVNSANPNYSSQEGVLFDKAKKTLILFPRSKPQSTMDYAVPNGVTEIGEKAFFKCSVWLNKVTLPGTVTKIGESAFSNGFLAEINIPKSMRTIEDGAFYATYIKKVTFEEGVAYIGDSAFSKTSLTSVELPSTLKEIGSNAFAGNNLLAEVTVRNGVPKITSGMFESCPKLTKVSLPDSISRIEPHAFYNCGVLNDINIPSALAYIADSAFAYCAMSSITLPGTMADLQQRAFYNCRLLKSVVINNGMEYIYSMAFENCSQLNEITIPASVKYIDIWVFRNCPDSMVIKGQAGSYAQGYAEANGITFKTISAPVVPSAPTGVKVGSAAYNKLKVTWTAVSGVTSYNVYRSTSKTGTYSKVGSASTNYFVESGLATGKAYYYKVSAVSAAGESKQSTASGAKPAVAAPKDLKGVGILKGVKLTWVASSGASGYFIYRCATKTGTYSYVKTVGKVGAYNDTKLTSGKTYYYKVIPYRTVSGSKLKGKTAGPVVAKAK